MKTLIAAALLLALVVPAHAATAKPRDFPDIRKWEKLHGLCVYSVFPDEKDDDAREKTRSKMCDAADKSEKKLTAQGYCTHGHGVVGRTGKKYFYPGIDSAGTNSHWTRHCYAITNHPYQQGIRDYRAGQCFRARPYLDKSPEQAAWKRGYYAQQNKEHNKRNWSHCFPGR